MKILVCISRVPDTTSKINFIENETQFDKSGVQYIINPNDEFGLTRAMWLKEKQNCEVHVISVGIVDTDPILRKALAIGADQAFRVDINPMDANQVAREISDFIKNKDYKLIIAGRESIDYNGGMVPGMIATLINANYVSNCVSLEVNQSNFKLFDEGELKVNKGNQSLAQSGRNRKRNASWIEDSYRIKRNIAVYKLN